MSTRPDLAALGDDDLRKAYTAARAAAAGRSALAHPAQGRSTRRFVASSVFAALAELDAVVDEAHRRGLALV